MSFTHLRVHTEFSRLDGACVIDDLVQKAMQNKMRALAVTDTDSLAGAFRLWHLCIKAGIKPIIGLETSVVDNLDNDAAFPVLLIAKNGSCIANLCRLVTLRHQGGPFSTPITKAQLAEHAQDLICLSGGSTGELNTLILEGKDDEARRVSHWFYHTFGNDYFYEIQNHGLPVEAFTMNKILNLAYETKIPLVLTNGCHCLDRGDSIDLDVLHCIRRGIDFSHPHAKRFSDSEHYFKSPRQMKALYQFPPQLHKNTLAIARLIDATDAYLPVWESDLTPSIVLRLLHEFSSDLKTRSQPGESHITVADVGDNTSRLVNYLRQRLPNFHIIHPTEYERWIPAGIYAAVLKVLKVPKARIRQLCELIPQAAKTLLEAVLMSVEFSSLSAEDYLCSLAIEIGDTLINTVKDELVPKREFVFVPKDMPLPLLADQKGELRCQFDRRTINEIGGISLELFI